MAKWRVKGQVKITTTYWVDRDVEAADADGAIDQVASCPDVYGREVDSGTKCDDIECEPADDAARSVIAKAEWWRPWFKTDFVRRDEANGRHYVTDGGALVVLDKMPDGWSPVGGFEMAPQMQAILGATYATASDPNILIQPCYARLVQLTGAVRFMVWAYPLGGRCAVFYDAKGAACAMVMECAPGGSETIPVDQWREVPRG